MSINSKTADARNYWGYPSDKVILYCFLDGYEVQTGHDPLSAQDHPPLVPAVPPSSSRSPERLAPATGSRILLI